jgi:recF protein
MRVDRIFLNGFRNYDMDTAEFSPGINIISGKNAQGKTNLLEAVYMLTGGKSFRTRFDRELIGFGCDFAEILADINAHKRDQTIKILLKTGYRKQILQNGVKKTGAELSDSLTAVLFCPDDLGIVKDGAAARRRLMDMAICQLRPGYAKLLSDYNKLYENKLRILKDWREKQDLLTALDDFSQSMCRVSAQIIRYRASFSKRLCEKAVPIHRDFSGGGEVLDIRYKTVSTVTDPTGGFNEICNEIYSHQASHRQAELDSQSCLTGAHKDDLEIFIDGKPARSFASQGQTRTAALSIKLAEREIHLDETGEYPVLLLDDVLSELDAKRQDFVLNRIGQGQTLITCCEDEKIMERTGGRVLSVEKGRITKR